MQLVHRNSRGSYGRPRITQQLRQQGERVSAERVRRSLKRQGLRPVYRRPWVVTTDSKHHLPVAPNLLNRRFDGWQPNRAWVGDITYVATGEGWLYLAVVMDLASRRIVRWSMSETIDAKLVCAALRSAYWQRKPGAGLLVHTGSAFETLRTALASVGARYDFALLDCPPSLAFSPSTGVRRAWRDRDDAV